MIEKARLPKLASGMLLLGKRNGAAPSSSPWWCGVCRRAPLSPPASLVVVRAAADDRLVDLPGRVSDGRTRHVRARGGEEKSPSGPDRDPWAASTCGRLAPPCSAGSSCCWPLASGSEGEDFRRYCYRCPAVGELIGWKLQGRVQGSGNRGESRREPKCQLI